ncbi:MAG: hypothetical protein KC561_10305, partial [Myxococcales bacterium]|nr:hypothetical protein [Myxococcales bacterium]
PSVWEEVGGRGRFAFEDTWAHPTTDSVVAGHGKFRRVGSEFPSCPMSCQDMASSPMPVVVDTDTGAYQILDLQSDDPALGGGVRPLTGCAHVAWTPDGTRLLCTEQGTPTLAAQSLQSRLYVVDYDIESLATDGSGIVPTLAHPLFAHASPADLFELGDGESCDIFHHKYAEWCEDERFVVATIGCGQSLEGGTVELLYDRVFLIDIRNPDEPAYTDLTAALETELVVGSNSLTSFTATCAPRLVDPDL